jgi:hypothetical protein
MVQIPKKHRNVDDFQTNSQRFILTGIHSVACEIGEDGPRIRTWRDLWLQIAGAVHDAKHWRFEMD